MPFDADSGPNLLREWREPMDARRWIRAGAGSAVFHILAFLAALWVGSLDSPRLATVPEIVSNIQRVTLTVPADLTQKAPNKSKVSKELNVEDLKPRPASERMLPTPAARVFHPPPQDKPVRQQQQAGTPEPPKIAAAATPPPPPPAAGTPEAKPPQIQPEERPKLAFETPGQQGSSPVHSDSKLQLPKTSVNDAIRDVARGGKQGNLSVSEIDQPPTLPETMRTPQIPGTPGSSLELLSDPMGVDFKPYLTQILARVRKNWFAVIPESAKMGNRGIVLLQFIIDRTGQVPKLVIATPSGAESLDRAAVASISASVPFPPLPQDFKGREVRLQFSFKYNVK
ncbi:MAG TPA: TonB family protein [Bryobacteraceae bacterium]|nr:TonB family protein [Bryobacteraceae bacterium]